jgi:hypothetical protein
MVVKFLALCAGCPLPPQEDFWYSFLLEIALYRKKTRQYWSSFRSIPTKILPQQTTVSKSSTYWATNILNLKLYKFRAVQKLHDADSSAKVQFCSCLWETVCLWWSQFIVTLFLGHRHGYIWMSMYTPEVTYTIHHNIINWHMRCLYMTLSWRMVC